MSQYLETALAWHDAGACVIRAGHGKKPVGAWTNYQTQRPTREQVVEWFNDHDTLGLGIVCGAVSGNMEMLEIEGRAVRDHAGVQLKEAAEKLGLERLFSKLMAGYIETTPSGGVHFLYRITDHDVPGNTKLAQNRNREVLSETRGTGGFTVIAPTNGIHSSGKAWEATRTASDVKEFTWEERNNLHALFRTLDELPDETDHRPTITGTSSKDTGERPGDEYAEKHTWHDLLQKHDWTPVFDRNGVTHWRRPGKTEGTSATTGYGETGNLHVFTTSTIFDPGSYSKFAAYAILEHNGNFAAAAKQLAAEGYGKPTQYNELQALRHDDLNPAPIYIGEEEADQPSESSWKPHDLTDYFRGNIERPEAGILYRSDGPGLLYPGKVHSFYGESESGKSWLAQIATAHTLTTGGKAIYIDFESDANDIVSRLLLLGVTEKHATSLHYLTPESARVVTDPYWQDLLNSQAKLIVIDGVTESLTMWGGATKENDDITAWTRKFPRALAQATGAAVVTIDHVAKNAETRGRFALGGQAKLAAIDGAAYLVEPLDPLAPGKIGRLTIRVTKDRHGTIRSKAGMWRKSDRTQEAAVLVLDATTPASLTWRIDPPLTEEEVHEIKVSGKRATVIDKLLLEEKTVTFNYLFGKVKGNRDEFKELIQEMRNEGLIANDGTEGKMQLRLTDSARDQYGSQIVAFEPLTEAKKEAI